MKNSAKTQLSVNVNKVALVRNTRHVGYPSVTRAAELCLKAGAAGITVHPRPDERHIRKGDVFEIAELMRLWPNREYNIEGNPFHNLMDFIRAVKPHQATFVPDSEAQSTSDHGWSFPQDANRLKPLIDECHALGVRVSLFMDPVPEHMAACKAIGADRVELYTETWASSFGKPSEAKVLAQFKATAEAARDAGLGVNAGHDLTQANLKPFIAAMPFIAEVSIGHAFVSDALEVGYAEAVKAYLLALSRIG
ncbi:MAG: pyridoxine 5'-phosphate synthase [Burkholderiales bacterium]|nr:MAG: pyridoxine 5'-phosphate synthase [Burkholderiales bacterium]